MNTDTIFAPLVVGTPIDELAGLDVLPLDEDGEPENDDLGIDGGQENDNNIPDEDEEEIADLEDEV